MYIKGTHIFVVQLTQSRQGVKSRRVRYKYYLVIHGSVKCSYGAVSVSKLLILAIAEFDFSHGWIILATAEFDFSHGLIILTIAEFDFCHG